MKSPSGSIGKQAFWTNSQNKTDTSWSPLDMPVDYFYIPHFFRVHVITVAILL